MVQLTGLNNSIKNPYAAIANKKQPASTLPKTSDVRAKLRQLTQNRDSVYDGFSQNSRGNLLINATLDYGKTLKEQRAQNKDSLLALKSVKYQFKNISSQIVRAKTSTSARQAVGRAEREVLRLKREKMKDGVDTAEIDAAINHAKAMERVARRKVKHLEQEEMAEASGGKGIVIDEEEADISENKGENINEKLEAEKAAENYEAYEAYEAREASMEEMSELSEELMEDMSREMQELMEDTGLEELNDALSVNTTDMEPEDLKMLKIKHRNKEMKDIVKADSEYLKAVFDHLEAAKSAAVSGGGMPSGDAGVTPGVMDFAPADAVSTIDIAL